MQDVIWHFLELLRIPLKLLRELREPSLKKCVNVMCGLRYPTRLTGLSLTVLEDRNGHCMEDFCKLHSVQSP